MSSLAAPTYGEFHITALPKISILNKVWIFGSCAGERVKGAVLRYESCMLVKISSFDCKAPK